MSVCNNTLSKPTSSGFVEYSLTKLKLFYRKAILGCPV